MFRSFLFVVILPLGLDPIQDRDQQAFELVKGGGVFHGEFSVRVAVGWSPAFDLSAHCSGDMYLKLCFASLSSGIPYILRIIPDIK
jgi:hypothetical protein